MDTILNRQSFIDRSPLQSRGNEQAHEIRDHQRHDDSVVLGHLENHQHGSHRRSHNPSERRAHADQSVGPWTRGVIREQTMRQSSD